MNAYKKWIIFLFCSLGVSIWIPVTAQQLATATIKDQNIIVGVKATSNNNFNLAYSTDDGKTFLPGKAPTLCGGSSVPFSVVKYLGSNFVSVGKNGRICFSPDGMSWTLAQTNAANPKNYSLYDVTYGNGVYVVVGKYNTTLYSNDLKKNSWGYSSISGTGWNGLNSVTFAQDKGRFVAVGDAGKTWYSQDGINWLPGSQTRATNTYYNSVIYVKGEFKAVGSLGDIWSSKEGSSWTSVGGNGNFNSFNDIIFVSTEAIKEEVYVTVGDDSVVWASTNGLNWSPAPLNNIYNNSFNFKRVIGGGMNGLNREFVAVGTNGNIWISLGGNSAWYGPYSPPNSASIDVVDVIYNGKAYVALGANGITSYSEHGDVWKN